MTRSWDIAAASTTGARHRRLGLGNQDGYALREHDDATVAIVTDGCGSAPHSEVGSRLGASLWAEAIVRHLDADAPLSLAKADVLAHLELLATSMGDEPVTVAADYFLFTTVGALIRDTHVEVFAIGDGSACIDGRVIEIGPFPNNQPPYLAYELMGQTQPLVTLWRGVAETVVIASDGATPTIDLGGLCDRPGLFDNRDAMRRYLARLNRERISIDWEEEVLDRSHGVLDDDTTIIAMRRRG